MNLIIKRSLFQFGRRLIETSESGDFLSLVFIRDVLRRLRMKDKLWTGMLLAGLLVMGQSAPTKAEILGGVSSLDPAVINPGNTDIVAARPPARLVLPVDQATLDGLNILVSLANGFPIFYEDRNGVKVEMCLDINDKCLIEAPFLTFPISFPSNFGFEAFYWMSEGSTVFRTSVNPRRTNVALMVLALESAFAGDVPAEDNQVVFARIRLRIDSPVPGTLTVTTPFGEVVYDITAADILATGGRRVVNETQDLGNFLVPGPLGDFTNSLFEGPGPPELPGEPVPRVDDLNRSIGPFLSWDTFVHPSVDPLATDPALIDPVTGDRYIASSGPDIAPTPHVVIGSPLGTNFFRVAFAPNLATPAGFVFDPGDADIDGSTDSITITEFTASGKLYNDGANIAPVAVNDIAGVTMNATRPVRIEVTANDIDLRAVGADPFDAADPLNTNVHGIDPQAVSIGTTGGYVITGTSLKGGTVKRTINIRTGRATLDYTPPAFFTGIDTFQYVVQDTGGLKSALGPAAAMVSVVVEDVTLQQASLRTKQMKWIINGTSASQGFAQPTGVPGQTMFHTELFGAQEVPAVTTPLKGVFTMTLDETARQIMYTLQGVNIADASSAVQQAHIHTGLVGENGPVNLFLCTDLNNAPVGAPPLCNGLAATVSGTLTAADLIAAGGTDIFADVVAGLNAGAMYVNAHTVDNPGGEIRGQIGKNVVSVYLGFSLNGKALGAAEVLPDGKWRLRSKAAVSPSRTQSVSIVTSNGSTLLAQELKRR